MLITGPDTHFENAEMYASDISSRDMTVAGIESSMREHFLYGGGTQLSPVVTPEQAMRISAGMAAVRLLANAAASLPIDVLKKDADGNRTKQTAHPLHELLHFRPSPVMGSFTFRQAMRVNKLLEGNAYAEIVRRNDGEVARLAIINPRRVTPVLRNDRIVYKIMTNGQEKELPDTDIIHLRGLSLDGVRGLSVVQAARATLNAASSRDAFSDSLARNGYKPSGVLSTDKKLSDPAFARLKESMHVQYAGPHNAGKLIILEEGLKFEQTTMSLEDAQYLEVCKFGVSEIARWFGVPPHLIGDLERSTNNNIEQQSLDFLMHSLRPELKVEEEEYAYKLLSETERRNGYYIEHNVNSLIAADSKARGEMYAVLHRIGAMSADEIRARENLNSLPDGRGKVYMIQGAMIPAPTPKQADEMLAKMGTSNTPAAPAQ
jgi:HK97 family phage portal protein